MSWSGTTPTEFAKIVKGDASKVARETAVDILRNLTFTSPIDTGRFVNNWLVGISSKDKRKLSGKGDPLSRGEKVLFRHVGFKDIWISNNLPYAVPLNNGHSQQAPANFVEKAVERAANK